MLDHPTVGSVVLSHIKSYTYCTLPMLYVSILCDTELSYSTMYVYALHIAVWLNHHTHAATDLLYLHHPQPMSRESTLYTMNNHANSHKISTATHNNQYFTVESLFHMIYSCYEINITY